MNTEHKSKAIWIPRILSVMMIAFFLVLSLDVFNGLGSISQEILAFAMHSIPAIAVAILLALSWKAPKLAGVLFLALAVFFTVFFSTYQSVSSFIVISLVPVIIGVCFLVFSQARGSVR